MGHGGRNAAKMWRFVVTSSGEGDETVLKVEGRLGHDGASLFRREGESILERGVPRLALHLTALDHVSSAGVRAIHDLATALEERSGELRLLNPSDPVRLVLDLSGLIDRLASRRAG